MTDQNKLKTESSFFSDVKRIIEQGKANVAVAINAEITLVYWRVGKRIKTEVLQNKRADYGKEVVQELSRGLTAVFGRGWSEKQLRHCLRIAEIFPDDEILSALRRELSWTHIKTLIYVEDDLKRMFYIEMCKIENWSTRTLQERIRSMLFERTAISKKPEKTILKELTELKAEKQMSPDLVFRDPYFLDFLGLSDTYTEQDLESAILTELQRFLTEMGTDFAFLARQKRITIDHRDYKIDLLFFHRRLKCLVVIDLKLGEFEAGNKGQMELYLNYLKRFETIEGENSPIGLILCSGKNDEHVDLMQMDKSNIRVADYFTILPPKELLLDKLNRAIEIAKKRLESRDGN